MNAFTVDRTYDDAHKIVSYVPTFNTSSKLEFNILPDKRYLQLNETVLKFGVEMPQEFVPTNYFAATLFQNLELYINHELVSHKSSDSDYFLSEYFFKKEAFNAPYDKSAFIAEGYFEDYDLDSESYHHSGTPTKAAGLYKSVFRRSATSETREGVVYYKYYFCCTSHQNSGNTLFLIVRTDFLAKITPLRVRRRLAQRLYPAQRPKSTIIVEI